jgi:hypothetical protein
MHSHRTFVHDSANQKTLGKIQVERLFRDKEMPLTLAVPGRSMGCANKKRGISPFVQSYVDKPFRIKMKALALIALVRL